MKTAEDYRQFLETPFWRGLREECYRRDGRKCQNCGSNGPLNAHHRFYRPNWFTTRLDDLVTLCHDCHDSAHANKSAFRQFFGSIQPKRFWRGKQTPKQKRREKRRLEYFQVRVREIEASGPCQIPP